MVNKDVYILWYIYAVGCECVMLWLSARRNCIWMFCRCRILLEHFSRPVSFFRRFFPGWQICSPFSKRRMSLTHCPQWRLYCPLVKLSNHLADVGLALHFQVSGPAFSALVLSVGLEGLLTTPIDHPYTYETSGFGLAILSSASRIVRTANSYVHDDLEGQDAHWSESKLSGPYVKIM